MEKKSPRVKIENPLDNSMKGINDVESLNNIDAQIPTDPIKQTSKSSLKKKISIAVLVVVLLSLTAYTFYSLYFADKFGGCPIQGLIDPSLCQSEINMAREQQENNIIPSIYVTNMTLFYSVNSSANYTLMEDRMAFTETNFDLTIRCSNVTSNFFSFDMMVSNISINTHFRGENQSKGIEVFPGYPTHFQTNDTVLTMIQQSYPEIFNNLTATEKNESDIFLVEIEVWKNGTLKSTKIPVALPKNCVLMAYEIPSLIFPVLDRDVYEYQTSFNESHKRNLQELTGDFQYSFKKINSENNAINGEDQSEEDVQEDDLIFKKEKVNTTLKILDDSSRSKSKRFQQKTVNQYGYSDSFTAQSRFYIETDQNLSSQAIQDDSEFGEKIQAKLIKIATLSEEDYQQLISIKQTLQFIELSQSFLPTNQMINNNNNNTLIEAAENYGFLQDQQNSTTQFENTTESDGKRNLQSYDYTRCESIYNQKAFNISLPQLISVEPRAEIQRCPVSSSNGVFKFFFSFQVYFQVSYKLSTLEPSKYSLYYDETAILSGSSTKKITISKFYTYSGSTFDYTLGYKIPAISLNLFIFSVNTEFNALTAKGTIDFSTDLIVDLTKKKITLPFNLQLSAQLGSEIDASASAFGYCVGLAAGLNIEKIGVQLNNFSFSTDLTMQGTTFDYKSLSVYMIGQAPVTDINFQYGKCSKLQYYNLFTYDFEGLLIKYYPKVVQRLNGELSYQVV